MFCKTVIFRIRDRNANRTVQNGNSAIPVQKYICISPFWKTLIFAVACIPMLVCAAVACAQLAPFGGCLGWLDWPFRAGIKRALSGAYLSAYTPGCIAGAAFATEDAAVNLTLALQKIGWQRFGFYVWFLYNLLAILIYFLELEFCNIFGQIPENKYQFVRWVL